MPSAVLRFVVMGLCAVGVMAICVAVHNSGLKLSAEISFDRIPHLPLSAVAPGLWPRLRLIVEFLELRLSGTFTAYIRRRPHDVFA
jgi:hypothetical protein